MTSIKAMKQVLRKSIDFVACIVFHFYPEKKNTLIRLLFSLNGTFASTQKFASWTVNKKLSVWMHIIYCAIKIFQSLQSLLFVFRFGFMISKTCTKRIKLYINWATLSIHIKNANNNSTLFRKQFFTELFWVMMIIIATITMQF